MPNRNVVRSFAADNTYHIYNRGVEKRTIFEDGQDYAVFLSRLMTMLSDAADEPTPMRPVKSFAGEVELLAYCLMPNHFHLLLYQYSDNGVSEFMRTLSTSYTMYFNLRNDRVGSLFQGRYKARRVDNDAYRLHISRYIHLNPLALGRDVERYEYSSMRHYRDQDVDWITYDRVLDDFGSYAKYRDFVYEYAPPDLMEQLDDDCSLA